MSEAHAITLSDLHYSIAQALDEQFHSMGIWVVAEIARINEKSGHRYLELVESQDRTILARAQANLWKGNFIRLYQEHGPDVLGLLEAGTEVMLLVQVEFHPVYGLKLNIVDISLEFAYGQMEKLRKETLERLEKEGIIHENKAIALPPVVQRIAVIGAPDSAGMADFLDQLRQNPWGYEFELEVLESTVQGINAVGELVGAISTAEELNVDAVIIVRGGGAKLDLEVFNHYELAAKIALCHHPVVVGIGHETDQSVVDEVANTSVKTPTACAQFILNHNAEFEGTVRHMTQRIARNAAQKTLAENRLLGHLHAALQQQTSQVSNYTQRSLNQLGSKLMQNIHRKVIAPAQQMQQVQSLLRQYSRLKIIGPAQNALQSDLDRLALGSKSLLAQTKRQLDFDQTLVQQQDPVVRLKQGYGIPRVNGKLIQALDQLEPGQEMKTVLAAGSITSKIISVHGKENDEL